MISGIASEKTRPERHAGILLNRFGDISSLDRNDLREKLAGLLLRYETVFL